MKMRQVIVTVLGLLVLIGMAACQGETPSAVGQEAAASMSGTDGAALGTVVLAEGPNGVLISADVTGLSPGAHGFHIHEVGACTPDFSAAGGHYAPGGEGHGFQHEDGSHAGDLPNLYAGADGVARADVFTDKITLAAGAETSIFDDDGSAIIIHAKPDSYGPEPGAGDRVACGIIKRT